MDKQQAVNLISGTFQNRFDKEKFKYFIKNLLNKIDDSKELPLIQGAYIKESFRDYVKSYERLGTYTDPDKKKIDVLVVNLQKETTLERARTAQRNFIALYLKDRDEKDAGLIAFVSPEADDWRFSFVKMEYDFDKGNKVKQEFTPARRYSYLVGKHEASHTAQSRMIPILSLDDENRKPTLTQIEELFSVEKATKEFFEKYRELFLSLKDAIDQIVKYDKKGKKDFDEKGINTVDFAKKLLGQIVFLYFLQKKGWFGVGRDDDWGTGPKNFLRQLFEKKHAEYNNFFNDILEPLFYNTLAVERTEDYSDKFNCKIPFLNGGLFDPINDYDWLHTDILLPDELFSNTVKTKEGDTGTGILDVFDRYNFTVKEDEPLEKEVAIDPEMLGKVFENLLEVKDRKSKGTYYTPREIVHYMCQQSLINYLFTELNRGAIAYEKLGDKQYDMYGNKGKKGQIDLTIEHKPTLIISHEDIETLVKYSEHLTENEARVKAKGEETDTYYYKLPKTIRQNAKLIDEIIANIKVCDPAVGSGAFPVGMMHEIIKARNVLTNYLVSKSSRTIYDFKRHAIQNSLYGVDIDPGAVEIAKLRLWLSLIVDENDIKKIQPLPNLDYKIVSGNSLLGVEKNLFNNDLFNDLERLKPLFFNETNNKKKQTYKEQIDKLISQITNGHKEFDFEVYFSEVFHQKKGFDVVIGNPPYGLLNKKQNKSTGHMISSKEANRYKNSEEFKPALGGMVNVFRLFIVKSLNVLKREGFFSEIFPLAFTCDISASALRKWIFHNHQIVGVETFPERDNEKTRVFENVKMSVCILNMVKEGSSDKFFVRVHWNKYIDETNEKSFINKNDISLIDNVHLTIPLIKGNDLILLKKVYSISKKLSCFAHCYTGEIDLTLGNKYLTDNKNNHVLIKGAIVDRYLIRKKMGQGEIKYLNAQLYLKENQGGKSSHYKMPRIIMQGITGMNEKIRLKTTVLDKEIFCANSVNYLIFKNENVNLKFYLSLLNSSLLNYIFKLNSTNSNVNGYEVDNLPIMVKDKIVQKPFIDLVDKILAITQNADYLDNPGKQAKVKKYEDEIDQMVYNLYDLTLDEIKIVEEANKNK